MRNTVEVRGEPLSKPVYWIGKQWGVTSYGIEALDGTYQIEKHRLWEQHHEYGWEQHMSEKIWVDTDDFNKAIVFARKKFGTSKTLAALIRKGGLGEYAKATHAKI